MDYLRELRLMPMLRFLIPLVAGIIFQFYFRIHFYLIVALLLLILSFLFVILTSGRVLANHTLDWLYGFVFTLFICFSGFFIVESRFKLLYSCSLDDAEGFISGYIKEPPVNREFSARIIFQPQYLIEGERQVSVKTGPVLLWLQRDHRSDLLNTGNTIVIPASISQIENNGNPYEFDYRRHMLLNGIIYESRVAAADWFLESGVKRANIKLYAQKLRESLLEKLKKANISGSEYDVASALILGYRANLSRDLRQSYAASGAMHILAVSGLHVGIIYLLISRLLIFMKSRSLAIIRIIITILAIWSYALITGLSPSVTRAATMFSFISATGLTRLNYNVYNILAASAFLQLLIDPFILFMPGFQLSYLAVLGIVTFHRKILSFKTFKNSVFQKVWELTAVSISAQIYIFPLLLFYFNRFPIYFILTNLLAVPLAVMILYSGLVTIVFSVFSTIAWLPGAVVVFLIKALNYTTNFIAGLPGAESSVNNVSSFELIFLMAAIISITKFLFTKRLLLFNLGLTLLLLFSIFRAAATTDKLFHYSVVVYNSPGESVYNFASGGVNLLLADDSVLNRNEVPYCATGIANYFNSRQSISIAKNDLTGSPVNEITGELTSIGNFIVFNTTSIWIANSNDLNMLKEKERLFVDIVILSSRSDCSLIEILNVIQPGIVVIDSSIRGYKRDELLAETIEGDTRIYDVANDGAFIYTKSFK